MHEFAYDMSLFLLTVSIAVCQVVIMLMLLSLKMILYRVAVSLALICIFVAVVYAIKNWKRSEKEPEPKCSFCGKPAWLKMAKATKGEEEIYLGVCKHSCLTGWLTFNGYSRWEYVARTG